jgi:hypothetical protein
VWGIPVTGRILRRAGAGSATYGRVSFADLPALMPGAALGE